MIITLQNCVGFCHTSTQISRWYMYVSSLLNLPPTSLPHTNPLGFRRGGWARAAKVWNLAISPQQLIRQGGWDGKARGLGEASRCMWIKGTEQIWGAERTPSEWGKYRARQAHTQLLQSPIHEKRPLLAPLQKQLQRRPSSQHARPYGIPTPWLSAGPALLQPPQQVGVGSGRHTDWEKETTDRIKVLRVGLGDSRPLGSRALFLRATSLLFSVWAGRKDLLCYEEVSLLCPQSCLPFYWLL